MPSFQQFENQQYLNIETFRRNGQGVRTPVWFARDGEALFVWTERNTGKAKRVRVNQSVNIAPCKADGGLLGGWEKAKASLDETSQGISHLRSLMARKYGVTFHIFALIGRMRRAQYVALRIEQG